MFPSPSVHRCQGHCVWLTPTSIIDAALRLLGHIDLDPCSNSRDAPNVPALRHFTVEDDGLTQPWSGTVFLNPPWSRKEGIALKSWVNKLAQEYQVGHVREALAILPAYTDQAWFQDEYWRYSLCFVRGRVAFSGGTKRAPFASLIVYMGSNHRGFVKCFGGIGIIYPPVSK